MHSQHQCSIAVETAMTNCRIPRMISLYLKTITYYLLDLVSFESIAWATDIPCVKKDKLRPIYINNHFVCCGLAVSYGKLSSTLAIALATAATAVISESTE